MDEEDVVEELAKGATVVEEVEVDLGCVVVVVEAEVVELDLVVGTVVEVVLLEVVELEEVVETVVVLVVEEVDVVEETGDVVLDEEVLDEDAATVLEVVEASALPCA